MSSPQPRLRGRQALNAMRDAAPLLREHVPRMEPVEDKTRKPFKTTTQEEVDKYQQKLAKREKFKTRVKAFLKAPVALMTAWLKKRKRKSSMSTTSTSPAAPAAGSTGGATVTPTASSAPAAAAASPATAGGAPAPAPVPTPTPASASAATASGGGGASAPTTAPSPAPITINCTPSGGGNGVNLVVIALLAVICFGIWLLTFRGQDVTSAINSAHERELEAVKKEQEAKEAMRRAEDMEAQLMDFRNRNLGAKITLNGVDSYGGATVAVSQSTATTSTSTPAPPAAPTPASAPAPTGVTMTNVQVTVTTNLIVNVAPAIPIVVTPTRVVVWLDSAPTAYMVSGSYRYRVY